MGCGASRVAHHHDDDARSRERQSWAYGGGTPASPWSSLEDKLGHELEAERRGDGIPRAEIDAMRAAYVAALREYGSGDAKRGRKLSANKLGMLHPEARGNPLAPRIFASFSSTRDGKLSEEDWIAACVVMHGEFGSVANKARTAFQARSRLIRRFPPYDRVGAYNFDGVGDLSEDDLRRAFGVVLGEALSAQQIEVLVQNMMRKFDDNGDGMIDEAEFRRFLSAEDYELRCVLYTGPHTTALAW
ncbi:uncharacterized protein MICPUCDRAFT_51790 [Micromonas pusilla CCMP1545]|uniref:Predicted protein n=1 Tax=Micromonas pusilla (strain CCMP1545) TaxID=564608 RepID=C1N1Z6_MICPC|nr:uncharacterized protein MICPUCDRAFT_51790 [Micromonas pusilla CCMP1545]EEH53916.1 predicted protein [Micromonas pusilla CCMP1545]|eukprot:XP_003062204.1 predicted protein [Micromonas pusilla CCMP1545]